MPQSVSEYVRNCVVCQRVKAKRVTPVGLLQPLLILCQVCDDITLDFIDGLPKSQGKDTILLVVDQLSKSAYFFALSHPYMAK